VHCNNLGLESFHHMGQLPLIRRRERGPSTTHTTSTTHHPKRFFLWRVWSDCSRADPSTTDVTTPGHREPPHPPQRCLNPPWDDAELLERLERRMGCVSSSCRGHRYEAGRWTHRIPVAAGIMAFFTFLLTPTDWHVTSWYLCQTFGPLDIDPEGGGKRGTPSKNLHTQVGQMDPSALPRLEALAQQLYCATLAHERQAAEAVPPALLAASSSTPKNASHIFMLE